MTLQPNDHSTTTSYYNQSELWGREPEPYQIQVRADILSMLPADVSSVLDVGCGDGFITSDLPEAVVVVGVDSSIVALEHLTRTKVAGSLPHLPFADKQFDLVMANDVLEHVAPNEYDASLRELERVARKYVLITCPHDEQLDSNMTRCAGCGLEYHINWHHRSFRLEDFKSLFSPALHLVEVRESGDVTRPPWNPLDPIRRRLGLYRDWESAVCPACGSNQRTARSASDYLDRIFAIETSLHRMDHLNRVTASSNRSEIMALYALAPSEPCCAMESLPESTGDLLEIDFANPFQALPDFTPGRRWSGFVLPAGSRQNFYGVSRASDSTDPLVVEVRLPIRMQCGDRVVIQFLTPFRLGSITLSTIDGLLLQRREVAPSGGDPEKGRLEFQLVESCWPDRFGSGLAIAIHGDVVLQRLSYLPADGRQFQVPFVKLRAGHNVIGWSRDEIHYSWGYLALAPGLVPKPCLSNDPHEIASVYDLLQGLANLLLLAEKSFLFRDEVASILTRALENETQRSLVVEREIQRIQVDLAILSEKQLEIERLRNHAEDLYADASAQITQLTNELARRKGLLGIARLTIGEIVAKIFGPPASLNPSVTVAPWRPLVHPASPPNARMRVLVLSHMFPHPDQPSSGPFIHEQVKALRLHAGVDARVVVCRPFWMVGKNPITAVRSNRFYRRLHKSCQRWWNLNGVPVAYLPYRIFGPWLTQGWSYRSSVMAALPWIRSDFDFDLVHAHTGYLDGAAGLAVAKAKGVPLIITEHTGPFTLLMGNPVVKRWTLRAMHCATNVIVVSHAQQKAVNKYFVPNHTGHFVVLPNVVDETLFHPPERWLPDPRAPRIVFVGYFVPIKQIPMLLRAFQIVREKLPSATLKLVGGGENHQQVQDVFSEIRRLKLDAGVTVQGYQTRADVARIMRDECDLLVLCSQSETFGCVLIEAMASGKPVVATRCGGPDDIITDDYLGRLCPNGDAQALARALLEVIDNLASFDPARIRRHAEEHFSFPAVARRIADVYESALTPTPAGSMQSSRQSG